MNANHSNANLVDSVLNEMSQNNNEHVLNYSPINDGPQQPQMQNQQMMMQQQGYNPIQQDRQVRMGEVEYTGPNNQQFQSMPGNGPVRQSLEQMEEGPTEETDNVMDAPDLTSYGMENNASTMMENIINQAKGPLIVIALAFIMSLPQVSGTVRSFVARFTTNSIYVNISLALIMGILFFLIINLTT